MSAHSDIIVESEDQNVRLSSPEQRDAEDNKHHDEHCPLPVFLDPWYPVVGSDVVNILAFKVCCVPCEIEVIVPFMIATQSSLRSPFEIEDSVGAHAQDAFI